MVATYLFMKKAWKERERERERARETERERERKRESYSALHCASKYLFIM